MDELNNKPNISRGRKIGGSSLTNNSALVYDINIVNPENNNAGKDTISDESIATPNIDNLPEVQPVNCNCRDKLKCPLANKCLSENIIYEARVVTTNNLFRYIGSTSNTLKKGGVDPGNVTFPGTCRAGSRCGRNVVYFFFNPEIQECIIRPLGQDSRNVCH